MELFQKKRNRCILHTERSNMLPKAKNAPKLLVFHGEDIEDSVCSKAPLCVEKHHGKV